LFFISLSFPWRGGRRQPDAAGEQVLLSDFFKRWRLRGSLFAPLRKMSSWIEFPACRQLADCFVEAAVLTAQRI